MNGILLWIIIVLLILLIGLVGVLIAAYRLLKEQINVIKTYKEIEGILNERIKLMEEHIDWLNTHHFDYRGLIEKGLAIAVTEESSCN